MRGLGYSLIVVICMVSAQNVSGQTKEQLEKERAKIIREIEKTNSFLKTTKKDKELTVKELKATVDLVDNIKSEINSADRSIKNINSEIDSLAKNYTTIKSQYERYLQRYYTYDLANNRVVYLLSSQSLNAFLLRWRYIEQFNAFKNQKQIEIKSIREQLGNKLVKIDSIKQTKSSLLVEEVATLKKLERDKKKKDEVLRKISDKEKNLLADLTEKQKQREKLNVAIERVIMEQIRLADAAAKKAAESLAARESKEKTSSGNSSSTNSKSTLSKEEVLSTEAKALSNNFADNKSRLPWPISSGTVSSRFGNQPHPTIPDLVINNNGIDIRSAKPQTVQSVFEGEVISVNNYLGDIKYMVIVKHGQFFTVYSHMESASVSKGQKVKTGDAVGTSSFNDEGMAEVHFELWKDKNKQNPESWLRRK
jgi:murein hydrolase activator